MKRVGTALVCALVFSLSACAADEGPIASCEDEKCDSFAGESPHYQAAADCYDKGVAPLGEESDAAGKARFENLDDCLSRANKEATPAIAELVPDSASDIASKLSSAANPALGWMLVDMLYPDLQSQKDLQNAYVDAMGDRNNAVLIDAFARFGSSSMVSLREDSTLFPECASGDSLESARARGACLELTLREFLYDQYPLFKERNPDSSRNERTWGFGIDVSLDGTLKDYRALCSTLALADPMRSAEDTELAEADCVNRAIEVFSGPIWKTVLNASNAAAN